MGPAPSPPHSAPANLVQKAKKPTVYDDYLMDNEVISDYSDFEQSSSEEMVLTDNKTIEWPAQTIEAFRKAFKSLPNENKFDNLENNFVRTIKLISASNSIFCAKCKVNRMLKKHGKVNSSYQFQCNEHTISAKQIMENLPDALILELLPAEPRIYFNLALKWMNKEHLCPELVKLTTERNAVKRFSRSQEAEDTNMVTSLIKSRSVKNGIVAESLELKERISALEKTVAKMTATVNELVELNNALNKDKKALLEENAILKRHLAAPSIPASPSKKNVTNLNIHEHGTEPTYLNVSTIHRPENAIMRFYTKLGKRTPQEIVEPTVKPAAEIAGNSSNSENYSPLKFVYFQGCHRKSASTYRNMLPKIGIDAHWARDITFLAEDLIQITTFESKINLLIKAMESISPSVKYIPNFNPCLGESYKKYGTYTDESAKKSYFALMEKSAERLKKDSKLVPSLKRVASFFEKVIEAKNVNYQSPIRMPRIFCLGDFITLEKPEAKVESTEMDTTEPVVEMVVEAIATVNQIKPEEQMIVEELTQLSNDQ